MYQHEKWMDDRIGSAERNENPTVLTKLKSGYVVFGDYQFLPGYCVLLGYPKAESLNDLPMKERMQFLQDMTLVGDAILQSCQPLRINYSILMNLDHYLHAHIEARYAWESEEYQCGPSWKYPKEFRYDETNYFRNPQNIALMAQIKEKLLQNLDKIHYWDGSY